LEGWPRQPGGVAPDTLRFAPRAGEAQTVGRLFWLKHSLAQKTIVQQIYQKGLKMASVNRDFWWFILAVLVIGCLWFTTSTPLALVILAGIMIIVGIWGWFASVDFEPYHWPIRLVSTALMILGISFLAWYFYTGHTILRPIFDMERFAESVRERLATPVPTR
jgi:hypothetical protein